MLNLKLNIDNYMHDVVTRLEDIHSISSVMNNTPYNINANTNDIHAVNNVFKNAFEFTVKAMNYTITEGVSFVEDMELISSVERAFLLVRCKMDGSISEFLTSQNIKILAKSSQNVQYDFQQKCNLTAINTRNESWNSLILKFPSWEGVKNHYSSWEEIKGRDKINDTNRNTKIK